jgi:hypothetical protein
MIVAMLPNSKSGDFKYNSTTWKTGDEGKSNKRSAKLTCVQLNATRTEATDLEIWVSGGRVLAKVGNFVLSEVA